MRERCHSKRIYFLPVFKCFLLTFRKKPGEKKDSFVYGKVDRIYVKIKSPRKGPHMFHGTIIFMNTFLNFSLTFDTFSLFSSSTFFLSVSITE